MHGDYRHSSLPLLSSPLLSFSLCLFLSLPFSLVSPPPPVSLSFFLSPSHIVCPCISVRNRFLPANQERCSSNMKSSQPPRSPPTLRAAILHSNPRAMINICRYYATRARRYTNPIPPTRLRRHRTSAFCYDEELFRSRARIGGESASKSEEARSRGEIIRRSYVCST